MTESTTAALLETLAETRAKCVELARQRQLLADNNVRLNKIVGVVPIALKFLQIDSEWKDARKRYAHAKYVILRKYKDASGNGRLSSAQWEEYGSEVMGTEEKQICAELQNKRTSIMAEMRRAAKDAGLP